MPVGQAIGLVLYTMFKSAKRVLLIPVNMSTAPMGGLIALLMKRMRI